MQQYYCNNWSDKSIFALSEEESRHIISVMRHKVGDEIGIVDGKGYKIACIIIAAHPKKTSLQFTRIIEKNTTKHPLHIAISPTKSNERFEVFIEKACEIGLGTITPILCQRTERKKVNIDRWNKIIISSCKQSKQLFFPALQPLTSFEQFVTNSEKTNSYIATIGESKPFKTVDKENSNIILIGPEGDFTEEEISIALKGGYKPISLGESILRVETAGIVATSQWNFLS